MIVPRGFILWGLVWGFLFFCLNSCALHEMDNNKRFSAGEDLQFDDTVYDFKFAGPKQKIVHVFKLKNVGKKPIVIDEIATDCGCTAALASEETIYSNKEGKIHVEFHTPKFEGVQEKHVLISTKPSASKEIVLTVRGTIKKGVAVFPKGFNFGKVKAGETNKKCVRLYQLSKEKLELMRVQADPPMFNVSFEPFADTNHKGFDICLELKPGVDRGMINDVITLHTNLAAKPRIDLMVLALIENTDVN